jgi:hypothetical protein
MDYYGMRRKRNLNYSGSRPLEAGSINWNSDAELEEGEEIELEEDDEMELEADEEDEEIGFDVDADVAVVENGDGTGDEGRTEEGRHFYLDGKPFVPKGQKKKQSFADTHVRVTTYFEKNVLQIIRILQKQGQIDSITKLVNDSIKAHLLQEYNDNLK